MCFRKKEYLSFFILVFFIFLLPNEIYSQNNINKINELLDNRYKDYNLNLKRIDSAIIIANELKDNNILGDVYFQKAAYIYSNKKYNEALEYYIKANTTSKYKNEYIYYSSLYGIAVIKQQLGDYDESIRILEECISFFSQNKKKYYQAYLITASRLTYLYTKINDLEKALSFSKLEFVNSKTELDSSYAYKNLGIIQHYKKNYKKSTEYLDKAQTPIFNKNDMSWFMIVQQYKGENYLKLNNKKEAIRHYKEVILLFNETKIVNNDIRLSFERLINYYEESKDNKAQLEVINNLLTYDSVFYNTNEVLTKSYFNKYENSQLIQERNSLIKENKLSNIFFIILIVILVFSFLYFYFRYKKEKNKLLTYINNNINNNTNNNTNNNNDNTIEIDPIIEENILLFEKGTMFNNNNIDLDTLSEILGYNRSIVSNYINRTRYKNFNQYINSLRIKRLVERLIEDDKLRKLTIDALAEECGFNSRKTFSDAFFINTGVRPSFFIKNIQSVINTNPINNSAKHN